MPPTRTDAAPSAWLIVACSNHVRRGVAAGFTQANHGKRFGLDRMRVGDTVVCYSPTVEMRRRPGALTTAMPTPSEHSWADPSPPSHPPRALKAFTALGTVTSEVYAADAACPWRRDVAWEATMDVPLETVRDRLAMCDGPSWGRKLQSGVVALDERDVRVLRRAMMPPAPQVKTEPLVKTEQE